MEINCREIRNEILADVKNEIESLNEKPTLAIVTCGTDEASKIYVRNKIKTCEEVGINVKHFDLSPDDYTQDELQDLVHNLNYHYNGVMVQLPLDKKYDEKAILNCVDYRHDVDGLTMQQRLLLEDNDSAALIPATAGAVFEIIKRKYGNDLSFKKVLVINRSHLIGIPLSKLLRNHNATVTIAHSKTDLDINDYLMLNMFDVVVTGIGKHIIDESTINQSLIVDCGITRNSEGKIERDVIRDNDSDNDYAGAVGLITVAMLMKNTLKAYKNQKGL